VAVILFNPDQRFEQIKGGQTFSQTFSLPVSLKFFSLRDDFLCDRKTSPSIGETSSTESPFDQGLAGARPSAQNIPKIVLSIWSGSND
jgi:hypothetical protein